MSTTQLLSPHTATTEVHVPRVRVHNKKSHLNDNQYANYKTVTTMKRETIVRLTFKKTISDFLGGPMVKNLTSKAGDTGSIPDGELRSYMPQGN